MTELKYLIPVCFLLVMTNAFSQDKLMMKDGTVIEAPILEKSDKTIKYKLTDTPDSPVIIIKTNKVSSITFRNGDEMNFAPTTIRMKKRFGVSAGVMVAPYQDFGGYVVQADYFLMPSLSLVLKTLNAEGELSSMAIGTNYYFKSESPKKLKYYSGLFIGNFYNSLLIQVPLGLNLVGKKGFDFRLGANVVMGSNLVTIGPELLLGWRF